MLAALRLQAAYVTRDPAAQILGPVRGVKHNAAGEALESYLVVTRAFADAEEQHHRCAERRGKDHGAGGKGRGLSEERHADRLLRTRAAIREDADDLAPLKAVAHA